MRFVMANICAKLDFQNMYDIVLVITSQSKILNKCDITVYYTLRNAGMRNEWIANLD